MLLVYENRTDGIVVEWKKTVHFPPHLHEAIEVVYVTDGDIELGVGQELYHMDEGDFAIVFPNVIHHYQVFGKKENKVCVLIILFCLDLQDYFYAGYVSIVLIAVFMVMGKIAVKRYVQ